MKKYALVIDEGTTGTRALVFDDKFNIVGNSYTEFTQYTPAENMVEHDAEEIYEKSVAMCKIAMENAGITAEEVACLGITNQRSTTLLWDKLTGKPLRRAIVWQDTRSASIVDELASTQLQKDMLEHCGMGFSCSTLGTHLKWLMDNVPGIKEALQTKDVLLGTIDTWLVWKLTGGAVHAVASSNASAMCSLDCENISWYAPMFAELGIPMHILPQIKNEADDYGVTTVFGAPIPITGVIADQQSALYAQECRTAGTVKCTNGTGTFLDINIGTNYTPPAPGLTTMVAWTIGGKPTYMFEGFLHVTGSAVQWLRDGLGIIETSAQTEEIARSVPDTNGVYFVSTLAGMNIPEYDPYARGMITGITRGTTRAHLVRATLDSIALGVADIMEAVHKGKGIKISELKIDGGASKNNLLAQMMADYIDATIYRPASVEATSLGAAEMAFLGAGIYKEEDFVGLLNYDGVFKPEMSPQERENCLMMWHRATKRAKRWLVE